MNNRCCFINAEQHCWNDSEQHAPFVQQHCSAMITALLQQLTLLTRLSNNDNNNNNKQTSLFHQYCSLLFQQPWTTVVASLMLNNIVETIVNNIVRSTTLFSHDSRVVTDRYSTTMLSVTTCAILDCVVLPGRTFADVNRSVCSKALLLALFQHVLASVSPQPDLPLTPTVMFMT